MRRGAWSCHLTVHKEHQSNISTDLFQDRLDACICGACLLYIGAIFWPDRGTLADGVQGSAHSGRLQGGSFAKRRTNGSPEAGEDGV